MAPRKKRPKLLSSTRPQLARPGPTLSSKATRTLIRAHHRQRKATHHAAPLGAGAPPAVWADDVDLAAYQAASAQGQDPRRGGDTSRVLVDWLRAAAPASGAVRDEAGRGLRLLEVGAVAVDNACARSGLFAHVERIDLRSRHRDIREQDFMQRAPPCSLAAREREGFDVVSLSLVLNFVPDAAARGEMLLRVGRHLRPGRQKCDDGMEGVENDGEQDGVYPGLFLVLPAPCVTNSRYLGEERLEAMMRALSYVRCFMKVTAKLVYYYFSYHEREMECPTATYPKQVLRSGGARNNFAIVL